VFDVLKGSGTGGTYTYPDQATDPYKGGPALNSWSVDRDMVLIGTAGHLHPGGLHDDLWVSRGGSDAHLFKSDTRYYEPAGAVSWDVAMLATDPDWRVAVHPGDALRVSSTYDTSRASWYESMGIMVVWAVDGTDGPDPFTTKVDVGGHLTHGHLAENDNHGGDKVETVSPDGLATTGAPAGNVSIADFTYGAGDLTLKVPQPIPVIAPGQSITFDNADQTATAPIWHTITACKEPCDRATGIAYPLADSDVQFDSGQLGLGGPPTSGTVTWSTPGNLPSGTYTYFCRIHPFMRGAFRVS
jgi:plastocyanin